MRTYKHEGNEYDVQFYENDIVLESPQQTLTIEYGYTDLKMEAIKSTASSYSDEGYEYDGEGVKEYVEKNYEAYIKENIGKAKIIAN